MKRSKPRYLRPGNSSLVEHLAAVALVVASAPAMRVLAIVMFAVPALQAVQLLLLTGKRFVPAFVEETATPATFADAE